MTVRLSININDEAAEYIKAKAEREGINITEAHRRIYQVAKHIDDAWVNKDEVIIRRRRKFWQVRTREYEIVPNR